jgi:hypothetical protein
MADSISAHLARGKPSPSQCAARPPARFGNHSSKWLEDQISPSPRLPEKFGIARLLLNRHPALARTLSVTR